MRRLSLLVMLALAVAPVACADAPGPRDGSAQVRAPSPGERSRIVAAAKEEYAYESSTSAYRPPGQQVVSRLHPVVVRIAVSRSAPRFASVVVELRDARGRRRPGTRVLVFGRVTDTIAANAIGNWELVAAAPALFSGGCRAAAVPHAMRALLCPDPWSVLNYPRPRIALDSTSTRLRTTNLHKVRWPNITLPGVACGATRPIELRDGRAVARSALEPWWDGIAVSIGHVSYGDIDGDGQDEAALEVICSNGGGTADGQLRFASILVGADGHVLRPAGVITARRPLSVGVHVPLLGPVRIARGRVVAREWWYGERDATCCPSGRATTHWTYVDGRLRPGTTTITRAPRR